MKKQLFKLKFFLLNALFRRNNSVKFTDNTIDINRIISLIKGNAFYELYYGKEVIESLKNWNDFEKLPVLERNHVILNYNKIRNDKFKTFAGSTGGTTGSPMNYRTSATFPYERFQWKYLANYGIEPWEDSAHLWRKPKSNMVKDFFNKLLWFPTQKLKFDVGVVSDQEKMRIIRAINRIQPSYIHGYTAALVSFAEFLDKNDLRLNYKPKMVWSTSSPLSTTQSEFISALFRSPVMNEYGSSEIPWIGVKHSGSDRFEINFDHRLVELDSKNRVIITSLENPGFPLIRYANGDLGTAGEQLSGTPFYKSLLNIQGRTGDVIRLENGIIIDPSFLTTIFDDVPHLVRKFQVKYTKNREIVISVSLLDMSKKHIIEEIGHNLEKRIKYNCPVTLKYVEDITGDRGKQKFIINECL